VVREVALPDSSVRELANRFVASTSSPSRHAERRELVAQARAALHQLPERDREVLVLRYLEHLSTAETAAVLDITPGAVKLRHLRAIERLRRLMNDSGEDES
jgi:RNA polymerase sigma-70 factor (ECF subfamily)